FSQQFEVKLININLATPFFVHMSTAFWMSVVVIFILAAIITPTGDPFTLCVVAIPLCLLYEMSILIIRSEKKEEETGLQV
ncbi:MAG: hypothetical protein RSA44_05290, partial [Bacteroides sp.]